MGMKDVTIFILQFPARMTTGRASRKPESAVWHERARHLRRCGLAVEADVALNTALRLEDEERRARALVRIAAGAAAAA